MRSQGPCPACEAGRMLTYKTRTVGATRVRYLKCSACQVTGSEQLRIDDLGRTILNYCTSQGNANDSTITADC